MILAKQTFSEMVLPRLRVAGSNPIATRSSALWVMVGQRRQGLKGKRTKGKEESLNSQKKKKELGIGTKTRKRVRGNRRQRGRREESSMPHDRSPQRFCSDLRHAEYSLCE